MDKKTLQESFEKHLIANGKYPKEAIYRDWEVASSGSTITFDIAVVVNGIVIQAFQLFDSKTESESTPTKTFTQTIDAVEVEKTAKGIYLLDGRRVMTPVKGINIINGKKVMVK